MPSEQINVLLIEDNPADVRLIQEMFSDVKEFSLSLKCSDRLSAALQSLQQAPPDVILLDLSLPDAQGLDSLGQLLIVAPALPIVILTGLNDDQLAVRAIQSGAQDYLVKGKVSSDLLAHAIPYAINRKRAEEALRQSDERFRQIAENIAEVFWMRDQNLAQMLYISPGYEKIWGRTCQSLYEQPAAWLDAIHPEDRNRVERGAREVPSSAYDEEYRIIQPNGTVRWIRDRAFPVKDTFGQVYRIAGIAEDITERKKIEALLESRAHRQAVVADLGQRALSGIPLQTLMNETLALVAETLEVEYCKVLEPLSDGSALLLTAGVGWKEGMVGRIKVGIVENSQAAYTLACNEPVVVEDLRTEERFSVSFLLYDHGAVSGMTVLIPGPNYPHGVLGAHTKRRRTFSKEDVLFLQSIANVLAAAIERKEAEERIEHQAYHDALTSLPNRLLLEDRLSVAVAQAHRNKEKLAVLLVDLDRFKVINDTLGHATGDELLRVAATRFMNCVREGDTVARMGGDEFAVLLLALDGDERATQIAGRIAASLNPPFHLDGRDLFVTASIGMAVYPDAGFNAQTLLRHADIALYRAKEQGRNTLRCFSPNMSVKAVDRLSLESALRQALERREFLLHYQPQVDLKSGAIIGFEALVRWRRPEIGLISPAEFIPLAEETGLIVPMGEWILRAACAQNKAWRKAGFSPMRVAVNLSARQFRQDDLVETVTRILKETDLDPTALELELTESILMGKEQRILSMLRELSTMGIQLSIDDFGTGYSSLAYLKRFPIGKLKVDQLFVRNMTTDPNDAVIAQTVVAMAHSLRLKAVAEGVETEAQLASLRSIGCDEMQGYLFSRPLPAEEATQLLVENKKL